MKNVERRSHRIVFGLFLGAQCLIPLGSIAWFRHEYGYPASAIVYHLMLVLGGYSGLLGVAAALANLRAVRSRPAGAYVLPLLWGGYSTLLYYSYLLAWGGRITMSANLTPALIMPYVVHPGLVVSTFSISPVVFWGILAGGPLCILTAYCLAAGAFSSVLLRWRIHRRRSTKAALSPARRPAVLAAAGAMSCGSVAFVFLQPPDRPMIEVFGDPIFISLVDPNRILPLAGFDSGSDAASSAYVPPAQFQKKNVILIVLDACRADHLGVAGYERKNTPFLNALQSTGDMRIVRTCYSASCCTFGGVMTLLRSQHWFKMTKRGFALQDVLKKAGYRVHFILGGDLSNFYNLKQSYGSSIDTFSDGLSPERHYTLNDDRGVLESFDKVAPFDGTPSFLYFHLMSVHGLSQRQPENKWYGPSAFVPDATLYCNNYDNGVVQADHYLHLLFVKLKQKGYLRNTVIFITGDHGDSVGERGKTGHGINLYNEEVTPPLVILDHDPVKYRNLELARQIDVAPTILDRLGLPIPPSWDGCSLLRDEQPRFSYLRISDLYAVIDHDPKRTLKYIYDDRAKTEELYDLGADPTEEHDIFPEADPKEVRELHAAIGAFSVHPGS